MTGSLKLCDHLGNTVRLSCEKCGRRGQYQKGKLIAIHGPDISLPDLLVEIAQCERRGQMHDMCGVHYLGLQGTL
ncbi:MAG: hypothetical protein WB037_26875 [Pseudolabrys sp.]